MISAFSRSLTLPTGIDAKRVKAKTHDGVVEVTIPLPPEAKQEPARRLADWLSSPDGQAAIGAYEVNGEQLFHPSAAAPR